MKRWHIPIILMLIALIGLYDWKWRQIRAENAALQRQISALPPQAAPQPENRTAVETTLPVILTDPEQQERMDAIKSRYEESFVNYLLMKACGQAAPLDYHVLNSALMRDIASINAPGRLQYDILTAAKGSFESLYAKTPCTTPQTAEVLSRFRAYLDTLSKREEM